METADCDRGVVDRAAVLVGAGSFDELPNWTRATTLHVLQRPDTV
jgi:hypothetical protein